MNSYRILLLSYLLTLTTAIPAMAEEAPRYVFQIPQYPGTEPFHSYSPELKQLQSPLATETRVYRTKDKSPLDKEKVIAFYADALAAKGWKKGVSERRGKEPYLNLRAEVYEKLADGTSIHATGTFTLWLAPQDGMLTIFIQQWRISSPDEATSSQVAKIIEALDGTDRAVNFSHDTLKAYSDSGWPEDYENEYLVRREVFMIRDKANKPASDLDPTGSIFISILTYRDADIARGEMNRRKKDGFVASTDAILTLGKSMILIRDRSSKQQEKVNGIAARLQELIK